MKVNLAERHWIVSAAVMVVAVPVLAGAGIAFSIAAAFVVDKAGLAEKIPLSPWLWLFGFIVATTALWFLMRWCARAGGWRALGAACGICMVGAGVSWVVGDTAQRLQPENALAGVGGPIFAIIIMLFTLVALFCGVIALLTDPARRVPPLDAEDGDA